MMTVNRPADLQTRACQSERKRLSSAAWRRRDVLAAGLGVAASNGPWFVRNARSSSGVLNIYAWYDYSSEEINRRFEKETGIRVQLSSYGSSAELMGRLRESGGRDVDIIFPQFTSLVSMIESDLLQEIGYGSQRAIDQVHPSLFRRTLASYSKFGERVFALPFAWWSEGIAWDERQTFVDSGEVSFGLVWDKRFAGAATVRARTAIYGAGLFLDYIGEVPSRRLNLLYQDESIARDVLEGILKFIVDRKSFIRVFWRSSSELHDAFTKMKCVVGQTGESSVHRLYEKGLQLRYQAPREGALTWMDCCAIPRDAYNIEQAQAYIDWIYESHNAGQFRAFSGFNSAVRDAIYYLDKHDVYFFEQAYPGDAIENLWLYPPEPPWFNRVIEEYIDKFMSA